MYWRVPLVKFAGKVTAVFGKRLLIVESDAGQLPPLYTGVANEENQPVGKIVDLYGSVGHPYLTVLCNDGIRADVGDSLYVLPETRPEKPGKKHRHTSGYQGGGSSYRPKTGGSIWKKK